jgi:hypothetical protein
MSHVHRRRKDFTDYLAHTVSFKPHLIPEINFALHRFDRKSALPITFKLPKDDKLSAYLGLLDGVEEEDHGSIEISDHNSLMYLKGFGLKNMYIWQPESLTRMRSSLM